MVRREGDVAESDPIGGLTQGMARSSERVQRHGWSGEVFVLSLVCLDGGPGYGTLCGFCAFRSIRLGRVRGEWQQHETYCLVGTFAFF